MEPSRTTYRWVAGPGDARRAARATFPAVALRLGPMWAVLAVVTLAMAMIDRAYGGDLLSACVFGLVWGGLVAVAVLGLLYVGTRRRFERQLQPGTAVESEFDQDHVVLRGPDTEARIAFTGIDRIQRSGDWVLLRQRRARLTSCWPSALFPEVELVRLRAAVAANA
jgi:hypothetical protein